MSKFDRVKKLIEIENPKSRFTMWTKGEEVIFLKVYEIFGTFDISKFGFVKSKKNTQIWWAKTEMVMLERPPSNGNISKILAETFREPEKTEAQKKAEHHLTILENL
jgi:L-rhamnose mutarotase